MERTLSRTRKPAPRRAEPFIVTPPIRSGNRLLAALPSTEYREIVAAFEPVILAAGTVLCEAGDRMKHIYFPAGAYIALISSISERYRLEVGLVGSEGMLGASLMLGVNTTPVRAIVQGSGGAWRMDTATFIRELEQYASLEQELKRYLFVQLSQLVQSAACTRFHVVEARLARWLLMTRDRAHSNEFHLTQEFIAYVLGVRRAGVTSAAGALQKQRLIRYTRGSVSILDARGLEAAACECYANARDLYARIMK